MSFVTFKNDCAAISGSQKPSTEAAYIYILLVIVSSWAVVMGIFALVVLTRRRSIRMGSMRVNLMTLTIFEIILNVSIFYCILTRLTVSTDISERLVVALVNIFSFCVLQGSLCTRNWIITLIALARCVAITRPVASRLMSTHLFRPKPLGGLTVLCILTGYILGFSRLVEMEITICQNLDKRVRLTETTDPWKFPRYTYFIFQAALPIIILFISTVIMVTVLLRARVLTIDTREDNQGTKRIKCSPSQLRNSSGAQHTRMCAEKRVNYRRVQNQLRATRMITLLAATFIIFESPVFFCVVLEHHFERAHFRSVTWAVKSLVVLDSCANVIIYVLVSKRFRQESARLLNCFLKRSRRLRQSASDIMY
ncbi:hypothetical protein CRM22_005636 [Opisthorchis felineus]|uniref:G-protein coupled receptors family 1 profile domain-containing protein n=1 Tax=Opisthorchis felineus TaxID=147828 RepID=A0A4S2LW68_OPIFE|nr:hypothetical protein CRM22_005636 [Opisthorchis felineus]